MNTEIDTSGQLVLAAAPVTELVVPVEGAVYDDRGAIMGSRLAASWGVPMRVVHVAVGDEDLDEPATTAALAVRPAIDTVAAGDGEVVEAISDAAGAESLVMLGSDNARQWEALPSVGVSLLSDRKAPVILCGPKTELGHFTGPIVIGLDGSPTAEAALDLAVDVARSLDVTLWLVKVVDAATIAQVERLREEGQRVSESSYLREVTDRLQADGVTVAWEVVHGEDPAAGLARFATEHNASMLVSSTHGATGLARRVFGSVSLGLVEQATMPVLIRRSTDRELELSAGT